MKKLSSSEENSEIRALLWSDYVGWEKRKNSEKGFITNVLRSYNAEKILDAALGDGFDSIKLLKDGFKVFSNEQDVYFKKVAQANANLHGVMLQVSSLNWENLTKEYTTSSFDAILCLGHSIGCVLNASARKKALSQFYTLLKPGGILIIDERNFHKDYDSIVIGKTFRPSGKYVYTGSDEISLKFVERKDQCLTIEYHHNEKQIDAIYQVYSFKPGEMLEELKDVNFTSVHVYSDYEFAQNPFCDYYQFIAIK